MSSMKKLESPAKTSTPSDKTKKTVAGRKGIHENNKAEVTFSSESAIKDDERAGSEISDSDSEYKENQPVPPPAVVSTNYNLAYLIAPIIVVMLIVYSFFDPLAESSDVAVEPRVEHIDLNPLREKFGPMDLFDELESGLDLILQKDKVMSYIVVHSPQNASFAEALTLKIAVLASKRLGNGAPTNNVQPSDMSHLDDYGALIVDLRTQMERSHVMVVNGLQLVPAAIAPVFHVLCDEFTPFVNRSLYLFTLAMDDNKDGNNSGVTPRRGAAISAVRRKLRASWSELTDEIFDPLFSRLAGSVLRLNYVSN